MENKPFVKFQEDVKQAILAKIKSVEFKEMLAKMSEERQKEENADYGLFKMIISTDAKDRSGEVVDQNGWETEHYIKNPVVLWGHDYNIMPVGVTDRLYKNEKNQLVAEGRWAPTDFAQELRQLYDAKILRAASVGFIVKEMEGKTITRGELIEWSFVSVPANPEAISLIKGLDLDIDGLKSKGFIEMDKKEGDPVDNNDIEEEEDESATPENGDESEDKQENTESDENEGTEPVEDEKEATEGGEDEEEKRLEVWGEEEEDEKKASFDYDLDIKTNKPLSNEARERINAAVKGAIEEELTMDWDKWEKKWDNIDLIDPIIYTFFDIYLRNAVPASDFAPLVQEMIYLFGKAIEEAKVDEKATMIEKEVENEYSNEIVKAMIRTKEEAKLSQKVGARLQEMQNEIDDSIVKYAQEILAVIDEEVEMDEKKVKLHEVLKKMHKEVSAVGKNAEGTPPPEGEETPEGDEQERSEDAGPEGDEQADEDTKALDAYLATQKVLRTVATVVTKSLENVGQAVKSEKKKK